MKRFFLLLSALLAIGASACTNFLVGKKASKDGATYVTYSADSYGMYGNLPHFPAGTHAPGTMRRIIEGDTNRFLGEIPEAPVTYNVLGNINEHQVAIVETTFGGREELAPKDPMGGIDYTSLMSLGLQRARTAREAIRVMTDLVAKHGYSSSGESFSIADPNEVWVLEMIGKGDEKKGAVWVAVRIPDDCIAAHANQSRIHKFDMKDKQNVMYAKDVIKFARQKGYFSGKDADFSFSKAYSPADFGSQRFCDARAWSFFNRFVSGMERYISFVDGRHLGDSDVMPLYFKPNSPLGLDDLMAGMRDHYEGTPFEFHNSLAGGVYAAPYQPSPLKWKHEGKEYFNERPISTQQAGFVVVAQLRSWLPREVGGVLWFGNDDPNMVPFTPVYCSATAAPKCYAEGTASDHEFSWDSAFWLQNWVSNMVYPRYEQMFPVLKSKRDELHQYYVKALAASDQEAVARLEKSREEGVQFLTEQTRQYADRMMQDWRKLGEHLIMKFNDQVVKVQDADGKWQLTPDGICVPPQRPGYPDAYRQKLIEKTGERFSVPQ